MIKRTPEETNRSKDKAEKARGRAWSHPFDKLCIHNYGGAGITMSWGTAHLTTSRERHRLSPMTYCAPDDNMALGSPMYSAPILARARPLSHAPMMNSVDDPAVGDSRFDGPLSGAVGGRDNRCLRCPLSCSARSNDYDQRRTFLSILKTSFAMSQLNLHGRNDSLQTLCLRSFSRCSVQFGKGFELGPRFKPRSLPFGISSWSFSAQSVHIRCV